LAQPSILAGATVVSGTRFYGVATYRCDQTFEQLFERADKALYEAKALGRNGILLANESGCTSIAGRS